MRVSDLPPFVAAGHFATMSLRPPHVTALQGLATFAPLDNEEVRQAVIAGLHGAIVGAPADPEAFG